MRHSYVLVYEQRVGWAHLATSASAAAAAATAGWLCLRRRHPPAGREQSRTASSCQHATAATGRSLLLRQLTLLRLLRWLWRRLWRRLLLWRRIRACRRLRRSAAKVVVEMRAVVIIAKLITVVVRH